MDFHVGRAFGDYSITGLLGDEGMERVYRVEHRLTKRTEAMRLLAAEFATEIQIQRFEREMRVLARLNHPNIAVLHNALHAEKQLIIFTEFIDGQTLESILSAGRLPIDTGIGYIRQILHALRYAHQQGVVHRDVTPANVMITAGGEVKLTDFGLSKCFGDPLLSNCGEILGSLPYLAPERLKGTTRPDTRSDLYSVGAILYEHLTGQKPFGANRRLAPVLTDSEAEPQPPSQLEPSLSPQWDEIIRRALARNPEHRYQSAEEFLNASAQLNQAPSAGWLLPRERPFSAGIALVSVLILALAASPVVKLFGPVAPVTAPLDRLHIVPPDFAASIAPPPLPMAKKLQPAKRDVHSAHVLAIAPPHSVETSNGAPDLATAQDAESDASQAAPQAKRSFWSKLNVFNKKRRADVGQKQ